MRTGQTIPSGKVANDSRGVLVTLKREVDRESQNTPEKDMEEIHMRATKMSRVLEKILHEPHGMPGWGKGE
jgi:hypothetical protein